MSAAPQAYGDGRRTAMDTRHTLVTGRNVAETIYDSKEAGMTQRIHEPNI